MDTELIRFRIDPEIRERATQVCAELGIELHDVLRAFVTRIARDGALPFDLAGAAPAGPAVRRPFYDYDERLWGSHKPAIDAEVALAMLARFIANCSTRIDEEGAAPTPDAKLIERLTRERDTARQAKLALDVDDARAVRQILDKFGPLVRAGAQ